MTDEQFEELVRVLGRIADSLEYLLRCVYNGENGTPYLRVQGV